MSATRVMTAAVIDEALSAMSAILEAGIRAGSLARLKTARDKLAAAKDWMDLVDSSPAEEQP